MASLYLGAAVVMVPLSVRLGLGSVLGYLGAGMLLAPVMNQVGAETAELQHAAEFGVVMMLFLIGLELEPRAVWEMRARLLGLGGAQVVLTTAAITGVLMLMNRSWQQALVLGMVCALSSTAIVLQMLTERNLIRTPGGRAAFSVLLFQDIAVVVMLAAVPFLSASGGGAAAVNAIAEGQEAGLAGYLNGLPAWADALVTLSTVAGMIVGGHFLSRPVFRFVNASRIPEMSTFISLLIVLSIGYLMMLVGLSPALGTFVAGVVLANSEFRHQIEAEISPFKGLLLGLFFMTVGVGIDVQLLIERPLALIGLTAILIAIKVFILAGLARFLKFRARDRWLFALGLAQGGEFGFVLIGFALSEGAMLPRDAETMQLVIGLSMLATPFLFLAHGALVRRLSRSEPARPYDQIEAGGRVIIVGIGRFGQVVNRLVRSSGIETVLLDSDTNAVDVMRRFGAKVYFGDPSRPELLAAAGLNDAQVLVVAVDDPEVAVRIVHHARSKRPELHIVARARDRVHVYQLYQAGADDIVRETFDSSVRAGRYVLENMGLSDYEAAQLSQTFWKMDRAAMRDLAEVWVPGQPVHLNENYLARVNKLDRDLEAALIEELEQTRPMPAEAEKADPAKPAPESPETAGPGKPVAAE